MAYLSNYDASLRQNSACAMLGFKMCQNRSRRIFPGAIILVLLLGHCVAPGFARQPNPSNWTVILSGPEPAGETVIKDQNQEIAVSGSTVHVMWLADGYNKYYLYYRRSLDNGVTWEQTKLLQTGNTTWASSFSNKRMAVDGNDVHITVAYNKGGYFYLNYFRSTDGGTSFNSTPREFGPYAQYYHHISASQGTVAITIASNIYGGAGTMWALISKDRGANFSPVSIVSVQGLEFSSGDVLVYGGRVYVLYLLPINVQYDSPQELYFASTGADGKTFNLPVLVSTPAKNRIDGRHYSTLNDQHYSPSIAADGSFVYIVWTGVDQHGGIQGAYTYSVYFRRSSDYGVAFGSELMLNQYIAGADKGNALETIAAAGGNIYVVCLAARGTNSNVFFVRSNNYGDRDSFSPSQILHYAGWWPTVAADPADATGKSAAILLHWPTILKTKDGGATWRGPINIVPNQATYTNYERPQFAWGAQDSLHAVTDGSFTFGGDADSDIIYRRVVPPDAPAGHQALNLVTNQSSVPPDTRRYDEMQVGMSPAFYSLGNSITIEYWMMPARINDNSYHPVYKPEDTSTWPVYGLGWGRDGKPDARIKTAAGQFQLSGGTAMANSAWVHVAFTYDATGGTGNFKIYQSGKMVGQASASGALVTGMAPLHVGSNYCEWNQSVVIDELRIWNKALTDAEIKSAMSRYLNGTETGLLVYYNFDGTTKDITGRGNDGVLLGREAFVDGYVPPTRKDFVGTWAGEGIYSRNMETGAWLRLSDSAEQIVVGDLDGDGIDDLIGNWKDGLFAKNSSTGKWVMLSASADWIAIGDLNGDNRPEVLGIWNTVVYAWNSASGTWNEHALCIGASMITTGDLDNDGKADLIGVWPGSGTWVKYSGSTDRWEMLGSPAQWISSGDINGDGKTELLGIWGSDIYSRDAAGKWTVLASGASQVIAGDLDGDGIADLIGSWASGAWVKYSGSGTWVSLSSTPGSMAVGRMR